MLETSVKAALRSVMSWLLLLYGSVALFNLVRDFLGMPLAAPVTQVIDYYRITIRAALHVTTGWTGITIPPKAQDLLVLWTAVGRAFSRTYVLLEEETHSWSVTYPPFGRKPLSLLQNFRRSVGRAFGGRLYRVGLAASSFLVGLLWPVFGWSFLIDRSVQKRTSYRVPTGATAHPSKPMLKELPPVDEELRPKFSRGEVEYQPLYDSAMILLTYLFAQATLTLFLIAANLVWS